MNLGERLIEFYRQGGVVGLDPLRYLQEFSECVKGDADCATPTILIAEKDPARFLAALAVSLAIGARVVLANPGWRSLEWKQVDELVAADIRFGDISFPAASRPSDHGPIPAGCCLAIPTGGTGGKIRFAVHDGRSLEAAARGFLQWTESETACCWSDLPFYHVSGLMPLLRAVVGAGRFFWPPALGSRAVVANRINVISLVPTQLARAMRDPRMVDWLRDFSHILVGGAAVADDLRQSARAANLPLSPSYGMTETAAAVCAVKPEDFLAGDDSSGSFLPHARVYAENGNLNRPAPLFIECESLFLGYWGTRKTPDSPWPTNDLGFLDRRSRLYVTGRIRTLINSGGEKIDPAEVESALIQSRIAKTAHVIGVPDPDWGERVTAYYVPGTVLERDRLKQFLAPHKIPKNWVSVPSIPLNAHGKPDLSQLSQNPI